MWYFFGEVYFLFRYVCLGDKYISNLINIVEYNLNLNGSLLKERVNYEVSYLYNLDDNFENIVIF